MATISPFKDYELTDSLIKLSQLYYETKFEYSKLKDDLRYKEKRLTEIGNRIKTIVKEKEEWQISLSNFKINDSSYPIIGFVSQLLDTYNDKTIIEYIMEKGKYIERDYRYSKKYWEEEIDKGTFDINKD